MKRITLFILLLFSVVAVVGQNNQAVSFTLNDRDRIIKNEQKLESLRNEMNTRFDALERKMDARFDAMDARFKAVDARFDAIEKKTNTRFESLQQQINDIRSLLYWGMGIIISIMLFIFGFIIWDRRTAMDPLRIKTENNQQTQENLKKVLIEYAKNDKKLAEILKTFGIL